jgi:replicative DNA helicase
MVEQRARRPKGHNVTEIDTAADPQAITCEPIAPPDVARLLPLSDLLEVWAADAQAAAAAHAAGIPRGPVTGLAALDRELGGNLAPGLHILHGEPGTGKTAFALQVAATCGTPAVFVTTEMGPLELLRRITARVTGAFLGRLKSGELTPAESLALASRAAQGCPLLALLDASQAHAPAVQIEEAATLWRERLGAPAVLVVVDSLHTWADGAPTGFDTEYERLGLAVDELRRLAGRLGGPVLAIAERNRASMASAAQSAGAGTRKLEYQAETVIALQREGEEWREDAAGEYPVFVKLAKNRNGRTGPTVPLRFHGAQQAFREV